MFELQTEGAALHTKLLAPVAHASQNMRFNDGRCDRQGRMWAGTMHMNMGLASKDGALYRYDAAGLQKFVEEMEQIKGD
jgi:sugar lactone lactonase YvrE